jgi:SNF2 family DNA or RNA helicase
LDGGWDTIIVDESLLVKNRHSKRTEAVKNLVQNINPQYVWLLSGAPTSRYYDDLWAQLNILDSRRFSSYWRFAEKYCQVISNQWSKYNLIGNLPDAASRLKHDLSDMYFSRTQEEVLDLPPWHIEDISIPMSKSQDRMYASMEEEFLAELDDDNTLVASNVLSQMIRLIQIASNPLLIQGKDDSTKWDAAIEMLSFEQRPAIMWTTFVETANAMVERLETKYKVAKLTGATPAAERQSIVSKFQGGELDVIVAHPAVGKFGLDLYSAKTVIYVDRSYNGDDYYQSLNRVRHIDAKVSPHIVHLLSERFGESGGQTVDHVINKILQARRENVLKITSANLKELFLQKEKA